MTRMNAAIVAPVLIVVCCGLALPKSKVPKVAVGELAPGFALKDTNGKEHRLSDYKGKIVVLEWSNRRCPFCRRHAEAKTAEKVLAKFKGKSIVWIGIDSSKTCEEEAPKIIAWMKKNEMTNLMLLDAAGVIGKLYGAKTTPHMFVIDSKGVIAYTGAMDDDAYGGAQTVRNYVAEAIGALVRGSKVSTPTTKPYGCSIKYRP